MGKRNQRLLLAACGAVLLGLTACASGSERSATLVLNDRFWQHVNVEVVHTANDDCNNRGKGYLGSEKFSMTKGGSREIEAPKDENICWRHDRDPDNPQPGVWSGWSKATLFPGQTIQTDL